MKALINIALAFALSIAAGACSSVGKNHSPGQSGPVCPGCGP